MANLFGTFGTGTINVVGGGGSSSSTTPATTTSATSTAPTLPGTGDRISIGLGPRLGAGATDTSGFSFTKQRQLTQADYSSNKVNFYNEYLGLPSLGASTGIDVDAPEVGEDVSIAPQQQDTSDDNGGGILDGGTAISGTTQFDAMNVGYNELSGTSKTFDAGSYSEYLSKNGMQDRVGLVKGITEPLANGNFKNIDLNALSTQAVETAEGIPGKAAEGIESLKTKQGRAELAKKGFAGAFSAMGPPIFGGIIGGIIGGQTVKNAFGANSLRPSGVTGAIADMVHSRQYQDMGLIRAAQSAANMESSIPGLASSPIDSGFALQFSGGFGVTRRPGAKGYTGNTNGLSHQQLKSIEAVSKGYLPQSYTFDVTQKKGIFGQSTNVGIEESGGAMSGSRSFYTATGGFYDGRTGQYSGAGRMSDLEAFARTNSAKYGISADVAKQAIFDARAGKGKVADLLKEAQAAAQNQRVADRKAEEARQKEREQRERLNQAAAQRARFAASQGGGGDDSYQDSYQSAKDSGADDYGASYSAGVESYGISGLAAGGTVGMAAGGAMAAGSSGFIGAPPSQVSEQKTVADDQLTEYPEGTFIINAAAVEEAGESDIVKMLNDAQKEAVRRGITIDKSENSAKLIDVAVSQGEVKVAPYLAKVIGYDRLRKINNRGKPEVAERQREASSGGFI